MRLGGSLQAGRSRWTTPRSPLHPHRDRQRAEAASLGPGYRASGYVFTGLNSDPMAPDRLSRTFKTLAADAELPPVRLHDLRADWDEWKSLLKAAGVRDARVDDARHTAATLLLAQGVDQRVVMEILGHSQISMTSRYAHVLPQVMTDAADRIGQALWGSAAKRPGKRPG